MKEIFLNRKKSLEKFKNKLKNYFINNKQQEWYDLNVTALGRVDLTIVSDKFEEKKKSISQIEKFLKELDDFYYEGFTSYYTIDDASFLGIKRPTKSTDDVPTWGNAVSSLANNKRILNYKKNKKDMPRIISFYSYKGGVGRTLALVQTAYLLAKKGKNVLLLDLDIEAPSLYEIFEDKMDISCGLVDYLYESEMQNDREDRKIGINDIFTNIKMDETLDGNIYNVPAGKLSSEYIFKLTKLQPEFISQKGYVSELLLEFKEKLDIDIVLIDSRTGINDWGAFSILDIADEVFFFAYPNQENVIGSQIIINMMKNIKMDKFTIVFSRVESDGGLKYAQKLFDSLNLKQEFMSIVYNPRIAVSQNFPNPDYLNEYKDIADFILEKEKIAKNRFYITNSLDKDEILNQLKENFKSKFITTDLENKLLEENKTLIISKKKIINKRFPELSNELKSLQAITENNDSDSGLIGIIENEVIMDNNSNNELETYFKQNIKCNLKQMWISYFMYAINNNKKDNSVTLNTSELKEDSSLQDYINYFSKLNESEIINNLNKFGEVKNDDGVLWLNEKEKNSVMNVLKDIYLFIDLSWVKNNEINLDNNFFDALYEAISFIKENIPNLKIRVIIEDIYYNDNKDYFSNFKEKIFLEWKKDDIKNMITKYITSLQHKFNDYVYALDSNDLTSFIKLLEEYKRKNNEKKSDKRFLWEQLKVYSDDILNLFWGTRIEADIYSLNMLDWFYKKLKDKNKVNPLDVCDILEKAIEHEINVKGKENLDCLISKESLEYAFKI